MTKSKLVSKAEFSRIMEVSKSMVTKYVAAGMPVDKSGKLDLAKCQSWVNDNIKSHSNPNETLAEAQTRKEAAVASLRELELQERRGELLRADETQATWESIISTTRSHLLLLPAKLGYKVAVLTDPAECQSVIDAEIKAALKSLSETKFDGQ